MGNTNEKSLNKFLDELKQADQAIMQKEAELNELKVRRVEKMSQVERLKAADKNACRRINAADARALVESSCATLKHIYKNIEEEAKENRCATYWSFYAQDEATINKVIEDLKSNGFKVEDVHRPAESEDREIKISW